MKSKLFFSSAILFLCFLLIVAIPISANAIPVDLELVLSVDVSISVLDDEFMLQRSGYEQAFRDLSIIDLIIKRGGIAATLVYWSGFDEQEVVVDWRLISDSASSNAFADEIATTNRLFQWETGLAENMVFAANLFADNEFVGNRQVIDISGDGVDNSDDPSEPLQPERARDIIVSGGVVDAINGLIIGTDQDVIDEYKNNVITGRYAFLDIVDNFENFGNAIKKKIEKDIEPIPEPSTVMLFGIGILIFGAVVHRKSQKYLK